MITRIYKLWHFKIGAKDDPDIENEATSPKDIGLYTTEENAIAAIERLKSKPGFKDWPDGFRIFSALLNRDGWSEGFVNPYDDPDWPRPEKE